MATVTTASLPIPPHLLGLADTTSPDTSYVKSLVESLLESIPPGILSVGQTEASAISDDATKVLTASDVSSTKPPRIQRPRKKATTNDTESVRSARKAKKNDTESNDPLAGSESFQELMSTGGIATVLTEDDFLREVAESQKPGLDLEQTDSEWTISCAAYGANQLGNEDRMGFSKWTDDRGRRLMAGVLADGHGGVKPHEKAFVSTCASERLIPIIKEIFDGQTVETDMELFQTSLAKFAREIRDLEPVDGACGVASLFLPDKLLLASVGDAEVAVVRRNQSGKTTVKSIFDAHDGNNPNEVTRVMQHNISQGRNPYYGMTMDPRDNRVAFGFQPWRHWGPTLTKKLGMEDEPEFAEIPYENEDGTIVQVIHTSDGMEAAYRGFDLGINREKQWEEGMSAVDTPVSENKWVQDTAAARMLLHCLDFGGSKEHKLSYKPVWSVSREDGARNCRDDLSYLVFSRNEFKTSEPASVPLSTRSGVETMGKVDMTAPAISAAA